MVTPSSDVAPGFQLQYAETVSHWMVWPRSGDRGECEAKGSSMASFIHLTGVGTLTDEAEASPLRPGIAFVEHLHIMLQVVHQTAAADMNCFLAVTPADAMLAWGSKLLHPVQLPR